MYTYVYKNIDDVMVFFRDEDWGLSGNEYFARCFLIKDDTLIEIHVSPLRVPNDIHDLNIADPRDVYAYEDESIKLLYEITHNKRTYNLINFNIESLPEWYITIMTLWELQQ